MPTPAAPSPEKGDNSETRADTDAKEASAEESRTKEKREPEDNDESGEVKNAKKTAKTAKDVEVEDLLPEHKVRALDGQRGLEISTGAAAESVWYQASESNI